MLLHCHPLLGDLLRVGHQELMDPGERIDWA